MELYDPTTPQAKLVAVIGWGILSRKSIPGANARWRFICERQRPAFRPPPKARPQRLHKVRRLPQLPIANPARGVGSRSRFPSGCRPSNLRSDDGRTEPREKNDVS